jgi:hypothetical protein
MKKYVKNGEAIPVSFSECNVDKFTRGFLILCNPVWDGGLSRFPRSCCNFSKFELEMLKKV